MNNKTGVPLEDADEMGDIDEGVNASVKQMFTQLNGNLIEASNHGRNLVQKTKTAHPHKSDKDLPTWSTKC